MQTDNPYRRIRRQSATLFICLAGLLSIAILHILSSNAGTLLRTHAADSASKWATYVSSVTPQLETVVRTGQPEAAAIARYHDASAITPIARFTILDKAGKVVYTFRPRPSAANKPVQPVASQVVSGQIVQQSDNALPKAHNKQMLIAATAPITEHGRVIGSLRVIVDQSHLNDIFIKAAVAGGWNILILVNLVLLACWFMYVIVTRVAKKHSEMTSRTDELTGLPSRNAFVHELNDALARAETNSKKTAVLVVKIDRFRELNDLLGHDGADAILCEVADRLKVVAGKRGYAARISGNTFGLVFANAASASAAADIGEMIITAMAEPFIRRGKHIQPKVSIGVSLSPNDGKDTITLLKRADIAQFIAHEHGGNQLMFFDAATAARFAEQHELENLIIKACDENGFQLYYQPLFSLKTRQLTGFEALIRLPDSNGGMVPPDKFIPIAEALRKIDEIGTWVLHEACRTASQWPNPISVAVNLSPVQFQSGHLIDDAKLALQANGLSPARLELEVTEGLLLENTDTIRQQLDQIQQMGIKIALDDFGTGYSSLNYLWRFPFDRIKIDRSFVAAMGENEQAKGILKTIVDLAGTMKLPITAEGIETTEQLEFLAQLGCETGQGYYLGRPQPATEIAATLLTNFRNSQVSGEQDGQDSTGEDTLAIAG